MAKQKPTATRSPAELAAVLERLAEGVQKVCGRRERIERASRTIELVAHRRPGCARRKTMRAALTGRISSQTLGGIVQ